VANIDEDLWMEYLVRVSTAFSVCDAELALVYVED
jgi:hypothetical protein